MCGSTGSAHALQHVNLLLVVRVVEEYVYTLAVACALAAHLLSLFAGGSLVTGARLHWDPSTYIPLRELLEFEYRVLAAAVPAAGVAMLALAHLAIIAAAPAPSARPRRALLYTYAGLMAVAIALELVLVAWVGTRAAAFMHSAEAEELEQILATRELLQPLLQHLARWHQIPDRLSVLIKEAETDLPWNAYVAAAAMVALLVLQLLGVLFAVLATRAPSTKHKRTQALSASRVSLVDSIRSSLSSRGRSPTVPQTPSSVRSYRSAGGRSDEWAPLKAKYKNGRIVPV